MFNHRTESRIADYLNNKGIFKVLINELKFIK